jgi:hypothetical protein
MADFVQVPPNSTGEKIAVQQLSDGLGNTVDRQEIILADSTDYAGRTKIQNVSPGQTDYGLTVRNVQNPSFYFHRVALGSGDAVSISGVPARITGWHIFNNANYPIYVKFHNTAVTPTAGTGVVYTVGAQAGQTADTFSSDDGIDFITGLGLTIVKGILDNNAVGVAVSDCVVNIHYKAL